MQSYKLLDYNDILRIINKSLGVFLCISLIILIGEDQSTYHSPVFPGSEVYVDVVTVIISLLIMVVCECMLIHERNESDPFVLFLMTNIIFFYLLRVLTLLFFPLSFVLPRFNSGVSDINQSLWFILFGIIAIFIGLKAFKVRQSFVCDNSTNQEFSANKPYITLLLLLSLLTNAFYWFRYYFFDSTPFSIGDRVSNYLTIVFNLDLSLLLVLVFLIKYWKELSKLKRCLLGVPLMLFLFTRTMGGSRSAIMTLGIIFLSAAMPVLGRIRVKVKVVLICIAIFFVTVPLFAYANFVRDYADLEYRSRHSFTGYLMDIYNGTSGNRVIPSILARAGYLDMATDMIVNRESYEKLINFNYYIQSIIDNGLTPGVNIFDRPKVPKASNALKHCYNPETFPTLPTREEIHTVYGSDMFTVFGEFYVLFNGYLSLLVLAVFAYGFKRIYYAWFSRNEGYKYCYRAIVLFLFYQYWLISYGLDWIFVDLIKTVIFLLVVWFLMVVTAIFSLQKRELKS